LRNSWVRRTRGATAVTLERWAEAALGATTLDDMFAD